MLYALKSPIVECVKSASILFHLDILRLIMAPHQFVRRRSARSDPCQAYHSNLCSSNTVLSLLGGLLEHEKRT